MEVSQSQHSALTRILQVRPDPFEASGAQDKVDQFIEQMAQGKAPTQLPRLSVPALSLVSSGHYAYLLKLHASLGIGSGPAGEPLSLEALTDGLRSIRLSSLSLPQRAAMSFLTNALNTVHAGESPCVPFYHAFEWFRRKAAENPRLLSGERLQNVIQVLYGKTSGPGVLAKPRAVAPELIRLALDSYSFFTRLAIGSSHPAFLLRAPGESEDPPSAGLINSRPPIALDVPAMASTAPAAPPYREVLESLIAVAEGDSVEWWNCALGKGVPAVFSALPPFRDERLYALSACAALCYSLGFRSDARYLRGDSRLINQVNPAINTWPLADRSGLAFLLSTLPPASQQLFDRPLSSAELAKRILAFYEDIASRPFCFDDLFSSAILTRWLASYRHSNGQRGIALMSAAEVRALDQYYLNQDLSFRPTLVGKHDLKDVGIPSEQQDLVASRIRRMQASGFVRTRSAALTCSALVGASLGAPVKFLADGLHRTGADLRQFVKAVQARAEAQPNSSVVNYRCLSRRQFERHTPDEVMLEELLESGNYPALNAKLMCSKLQPQQVCEWLRNDAAHNLVEPEYFCQSLERMRREFPELNIPIEQIICSPASAGIFAKVIRHHDPSIPEITLSIGYKAGSHVGLGLRHMIHERKSDGSIAQLFPETKIEAEAVRKFVKQAVLFVAGEGTTVIPSRIYPDSHVLLTGPLEGRSGQFLTLVLARLKDDTGSEERMQVITGIYHPSVKALRACLKREFRGLADKLGARPAFRDRVLTALESGNALLERSGADKILLADIGVPPEAAYRGPPRRMVMEATLDSLGGPDIERTEPRDSGIREEVEPEICSLSAAGDSMLGELAAIGAGDDDQDSDCYLAREGYLFNPSLGALLL